MTTVLCFGMFDLTCLLLLEEFISSSGLQFVELKENTIVVLGFPMNVASIMWLLMASV